MHYNVLFSLKIDGISKLHLGLNISIKLNEMLIDAIVIFLAFMGRLKRLFAKTACGQKYLSQKTLQTAKKNEKNTANELINILYLTFHFACH